LRIEWKLFFPEKKNFEKGNGKTALAVKA